MGTKPPGWGADRQPASPPLWTRYLLAALAVVLAGTLRSVLDPILREDQPFIIFLTTAALISWRLGLGPGVFGLFLGTAVGDYFFAAPRGHFIFSAEPVRGVVLWLNCLGLGFLICWVCGYLRQAQRRAEETTREVLQAKDALKASEQRLRLALEAGSIGVWSGNIHSEIVEADGRVLELFGLQGHGRQLRKEQFFERVHPEDREQAMHVLQSAIENRQLFRLEYRVVLPGGEVRWVGGIIKRIDQGGGSYVLGVNFDVTESREKSEELEKKAAERTASLETSLASIEELLYTIAHDLRAPNRAMEGYAQLLLHDYGGRLDGTARSYLERIREACIRSDQLIQDILQYGRLSHVRHTRSVIDSKAIVTEALRQVQPMATDRGARIEIQESEPWPLLIGNESLLKQILVQLLNNAITYVPTERKPEIQVSARSEDGRAILMVADNGVGIPTEQRGQVFKPFLRLPTSLDRPGTGMGLAIVRKAAERMNGATGVESTPGEGSCFWVELPRAKKP